MDGYMRIGELSRRTGVSPELLRAWERRYGLLEPTRSEGGYRLYSDLDLVRLRAMQANLEAGLSAAQAAALAREARDDTAVSEGIEAERTQLQTAIDRFDDAAAHSVVDRALTSYTTDTVMTELVLPYLAELGRRWEGGQVSVAHEHFASNLLRGRLLGLARGWDRGAGPRAVLAGAPGELHDLPLIIFGLALRERGWRITYLGGDTPLFTATDAARQLDTELLVLSTTRPEHLEPLAKELAEAARDLPLCLAGAGVRGAFAERVGARFLDGDPVSEAERVTRELAARPA